MWFTPFLLSLASDNAYITMSSTVPAPTKQPLEEVCWQTSSESRDEGHHQERLVSLLTVEDGRDCQRRHDKCVHDDGSVLWEEVWMAIAEEDACPAVVVLDAVHPYAVCQSDHLALRVELARDEMDQDVRVAKEGDAILFDVYMKQTRFDSCFLRVCCPSTRNLMRSGTSEKYTLYFFWYNSLCFSRTFSGFLKHPLST